MFAFKRWNLISLTGLKRTICSARKGRSTPLTFDQVTYRKKSRNAIAIGVGAALAAAFTIPAQATNEKTGVTVEELQKHTKPDDVWVAVNGEVYDLSEFAPAHPGGAKIIYQYAGKNASSIFNHHHAPSVIAKMLSPEKHLGPLIGDLEPAPDVTAVVIDQDAEAERKELVENLPDISQIVNPTDFEYVARKILPPTAWEYYSSGSEDEMSLRENHNAFHRIFFRPRVMRDVSGNIDLSTTMLGTSVAAPFYCSAAAQARLGNPEGEKSIARGCGTDNVFQMISTSASFPLDEIAGQIKNQPQWFQLYVGDDQTNKDLVTKAVSKPTVSGVFVTVDVAAFGRREKDLKLRAELANASSRDSEELSAGVSYTREHVVTWPMYDMIKGLTEKPVALKGVQSVEDVLEAAEHGVPAVVISNHGGRQLDFSRAPIEVLADTMPELRRRGLADKIEIYIDGGARRGSDVLKALCLGARGVGFGRLYLYANACYGEKGVRKLNQMLMEEMTVCMKLLGVTSLEELGPEYLDLRALHTRNPPQDQLFYRNYEPLSPPRFGNE